MVEEDEEKKESRGDHERYSWSFILVVLTVYISLNFFLNFSNKYLFAVYHFKYPLLIILLGTLCTTIGTGILVYTNPSSTSLNRQTLLQNWKPITALGVVHAFGSAFENLALTRVSISVAQMIKASAPIFFMLYGSFIEKKTYHQSLKISMLVQVFGASLAVYDNPEMDPLGLMYVFISLITGSFLSLLISEKLMKETKFTSVETAFVSSFPSLVSLLSLMESSELKRLRGVLDEGTIPLLIVFATALCAFFYNIVHFKTLEVTNSLYMFAFFLIKILC